MNKELVETHQQAWTDEDIATRGIEMTKRLCGVWRRQPTTGSGALAIDD
jgi:hypothetical protein